jgi:hypothetical protein
MSGYYGQPVVKPPVWTWQVPLYFFTGGLGGMSALIAFACLVFGADRGLVRVALWLATACAIVSPALLIADLGRPGRFLNMLRVFKPQSAMSVGAWLLSAFGASVVPAALIAQLAPWHGGWHALLFAAAGPAALFGTLLAVYTGVLIGTTAVPAWAAHHRVLPLHFGAAAIGSAAGLLEIVGFRERALWGIALAASIVETGIGLWLELRRHGAIDRALHHGLGGALLRAGGLLTGPLALGLRLVDLRLGAALCLVVGALVSRYGWMSAGKASARDPEAALAAARPTPARPAPVERPVAADGGR